MWVNFRGRASKTIVVSSKISHKVFGGVGKIFHFFHSRIFVLEIFPDLLPEHQLRDADSQNIYAITGILPVSRAKHRIMCAVGKI